MSRAQVMGRLNGIVSEYQNFLKNRKSEQDNLATTSMQKMIIAL